MLAPIFYTIANMAWCTKHTISLFLANLFYFSATSTQSYTRIRIVVSS